MTCYYIDMLKNFNILQAKADDPELLKELYQVVEIAYRNKKSTTDALAILRVVDGLTLDDWHKMTAAFNLDDWLAFSLNTSKAQAVKQIIDVQQKLTFQRDHDPLTEIPNRRFFFSALERELNRAERNNTEISIILLDLDDFKKVNDTYGHLCGDTVLKRLAKLLKESVRCYDVVARMGGEEFLVLLPDTSIIASAIVADTIRSSFAAEVFVCSNQKFSVTLSAGVSSNKLVKGKLSTETLVNSADEAMYKAKRQGKNCIVAAGSVSIKRDQKSLVGAEEKKILFTGSLSDMNNEKQDS